jgi:hypothetical protein
MASPSPPASAKLCEICVAADAKMYCRADAARLCLGCDQEVRARRPSPWETLFALPRFAEEGCWRAQRRAPGSAAGRSAAGGAAISRAPRAGPARGRAGDAVSRRGQFMMHFLAG